MRTHRDLEIRQSIAPAENPGGQTILLILR